MIVHADFCLTNQILLPTPLWSKTKKAAEAIHEHDFTERRNYSLFMQHRKPTGSQLAIQLLLATIATACFNCS